MVVEFVFLVVTDDDGEDGGRKEIEVSRWNVRENQLEICLKDILVSSK